jgi:hypothetical protein
VTARGGFELPGDRKRRFAELAESAVTIDEVKRGDASALADKAKEWKRVSADASNVGSATNSLPIAKAKTSARRSDLFADIPNGQGAALRALAEDTGKRRDTALSNALGADIAASADVDVNRSLVRVAIRLCISKTERAIIREQCTRPGKAKIIPAGLFDQFAEPYPIRSNIPRDVPSAPIGHSVYYMDKQAGAIMAVSREGDPYPIVAAKDFEVTENIQIRDITPERKIGGPVSSAYVTRYVDPNGSETKAEILFSDLSEMRNPDYPKTTGIAPYLSPKKTKAVADAIASIGQHAPRTIGVDGTGPLWTPDGYVFLRQGKPALTASGFDSEYRAIISETHKGISVLDIGDPSETDEELADLLDYMRIGDATPDQPHIALGLLGSLAWCPCGPVPGFGNVNYLIYGESGSLKTALAGLAIAAQSSHELYLGKGREVPAQLKMRNNQSTTFGADNALYHLGGTLALVDDLFAGAQSERAIAQAYDRLSGMADNIATQTGGTRGRPQSASGQGLAKLKFPRSSAVYTAEALPDEQGHVSETARIAISKMEQPVSKAILSELQDTANGFALTRAHSALIRSALPSFDRHRIAYKIASEAVDSWNLGGHLRPSEQWKRIAAGLYVISARYGELADSDPRAFGDSAIQEIREGARSQVARSGIRGGHDITRDPVRLFVKNMRLMLKDHAEFFASPKMNQSGNYVAPQVEGYTPGAFGWRMAGNEYAPATGTPIGAVVVWDINAGAKEADRPPKGYEVRAFVTKTGWNDLYTSVYRYTQSNDGWSLPSPDAMLEKLASNSYIMTDDSGSPKIGQSRIFDKVPRGYNFRILAILAGEMPGDEPDTESGEADPGPEDAPRAPGGGGAPGFLADPIPGTEPPTVEPAASGLEPDAKPVRGKRAKEPAESHEPHLAAALGVAESGTGLAVYFRADGSGPMGSNRGPFAVPDAPKSLAECYRLARGYALAELWIHASAVRMIGLPSAKTISNRPGEGTPHKWGKTPDDLEREPKYAGTVSGWMPLWRADIGRSGSEVAIVVPAYDSRNAFGDAGTAQELIDSVELFNSALAKDVRFRWAPNPTMKKLARSVSPKYRIPVRSVTRDEIPAIREHSQLLGMDWDREPEAGELRSGFLVIDRNGAEISGFGTDYIGFGEPDHITTDVRFKRGTAGYYRLRNQVTGYDTRLPDLSVRPGSNGSLWITGPDAELLDSLGILPPLAEGWLWAESGRYLSGMYGALRKGREFLNNNRKAPGGNLAYGAYSAAWHSFIGELADTHGARGDDDNTFRPDIRHAVKAETYARMYRGLLQIAKASGRYPLATHVDAVVYAANNDKDIPEGAPVDSRIGSYKPEKYLTGRWNHGSILPWRS